MSVTKPNFLLALPFLLGLGLTAACSGGDKDPVVSITDATPPTPDSSTVVYDAAPCAGSVCDGLCVDTSTDSLNCGGCGEACDSAGQICSGTLPCACPADFLPAQIGGSGFDQFIAQGPVIVAIAPIVGATLDVGAVVFDLTLEIGVEYDLAEGIGTLSAPAAAAGNNVDINTFSAHTPYGATQGTIVFDSICAEGVSGTMTNVVFSEVAAVTDPTIVEGGCSTSSKAISFNIGSCPKAGPGGN